MAADIVPIELGLPQGDVVTLWAPRWREDGEEWEAFLGNSEDLYAFPDAAHLAAYVRTAGEHDLSDHPAWHVVPALTVPELLPDADHQFDLVGVPELVTEEPDTWTLGELAEIVAIARSLAEVCELDTVREVLDSADGFSLLDQGRLPFTGREGQRLWEDLTEVVAERWDDLLDEIDQLVSTPDVDADELEKTSEELAAYTSEAAAAGEELSEDDDIEPIDDSEDSEAGASDEAGTDEEAEEPEADEDEEPVGFWGEVGIDPIKVITSGQEYYTLRCYLDDEPIFHGSNGSIEVFTSAKALARNLAEPSAKTGSDLSEVSTWNAVTTKATAGELEVEVDADNTYVLQGIDEDIADGPDTVDPTQLDLAVELLTDAADWADDDSVNAALRSSEPLGWLVSFVVRPDPLRLAPSAPYTAEVEAWRGLVDAFERRLRKH
ncbi:MAG: primosomal protein [Pseudonocardiaceae bacterium]|nr:primosomal protein [Pseudonocardiaceae bacterium]